MIKQVSRLYNHILVDNIVTLVRVLQTVSGVSLMAYTIATGYNIHLAYPWFVLGNEWAFQCIMGFVAFVQIACGIFHCYRCTCLSSWPAAVMFTYVSICAKTDLVPDRYVWVAAGLLAAINWFVSSVSSKRMRRNSRGHNTSQFR